MRMWQPFLESLLHHALIVDPLCWSFCLGCLRGLSLGVCHFLLSWPWLVEDRVVLDDVSQQFGPSLFVLEGFFFLGVGLGLDMRWVGVARPFGTTIALQNLAVQLLGQIWGFWCPGVLQWLVKSYHLSAPEPFHLPKTRFWRFGTWSESSLNYDGFVFPMLDGVMVIQRGEFLWSYWAGKTVRLP